MKILCLPDTTFARVLKVVHEKNWKRLGVLEHNHLPDFPSSSHSGRSRNRSPRSPSIEDLDRLLVDWEREIIFHCKSILYLQVLSNHYTNHPFL